MDIILLEKVANLGNIGDKVSVKAGFGRNFLIPYGKAVPATKDNVASFAARRAELEANAAAKLATAQARAAKLQNLSISIAHNAGNEGKLFGSVGAVEVARAITAAGVEVAKAEVRMPNGPIREVGSFNITVSVHSDVSAQVNVVVVAE